MSVLREGGMNIFINPTGRLVKHRTSCGIIYFFLTYN